MGTRVSCARRRSPAHGPGMFPGGPAHGHTRVLRTEAFPRVCPRRFAQRVLLAIGACQWALRHLPNGHVYSWPFRPGVVLLCRSCVCVQLVTVGNITS